MHVCICNYVYIYIYVYTHSYASRVRLKGYAGPFQSSETIMTICYFNSTLFNSFPLAYIYKQSMVERVRWSFSEHRQVHVDCIVQQYFVHQYSTSLLRWPLTEGAHRYIARDIV